jgi:hypothetical protein
MRTLQVPDSIFERLQKLAIPLVDNDATLIERLLDNYESKRNGDRGPSTVRKPNPNSGVRELDPDAPGELRHTRVVAASFAGQKATGWNELVHVAHMQAISRLGSFDALRKATRSNIALGRQSGRGFRHVPEIDVSIQNVDAEHAWANVLRLARQLNLEVQVDFEWLDKKEAHHPGERGHLIWRP